MLILFPLNLNDVSLNTVKFIALKFGLKVIAQTIQTFFFKKDRCSLQFVVLILIRKVTLCHTVFLKGNGACERKKKLFEYNWKGGGVFQPMALRLYKEI